MNFLKSTGLGVQIDFFDFCIWSHHSGLSSEKKLGAQHPVSATRFACRAQGALRIERPHQVQGSSVKRHVGFALLTLPRLYEGSELTVATVAPPRP
jgi:hypothetical protein